MSAELELARLEARTLRAADMGAFLGRVAELRVLLARELAGDVKNIVLAMLPPAVEAQLLAAVADAYQLGADDALLILGGMGLDDVRRVGRPSKAARATVKGIDRAGRTALVQAQRLARLPDAAEADVLAPLFGHADRLQRAASDGINMSGNEGVRAVSDAAGLPIVWVAETDACVHCLAYSGTVVARGESFPGGLTYAAKTYHTTPIRTPPRHPRCRCTLEPLQSQEYADSLKREADRSVLLGFSLESESMGTRIDAAKRLVEHGVDAPKSVIDYARRSVKRGTFATRGRPGG